MIDWEKIHLEYLLYWCPAALRHRLFVLWTKIRPEWVAQAQEKRFIEKLIKEREVRRSAHNA